MEDLGGHYRQARGRLTALLRDADASAWEVPVPACPGWRVHDVVAHLVGVIEDAAAGRLTGPPDEEMTREEVERHRDDPSLDLLAQWEQMAPVFEPVLTERQIWPAVLDVVSHEHDIRGALDRPGARDEPFVALAAERLVGSLALDGTLTVDIGLRTVSSSPADGPDHALTATAFEVLRFRLGRRSRDQVAALAWSSDPAPILDQLFTFGPAPVAIDE